MYEILIEYSLLLIILVLVFGFALLNHILTVNIYRRLNLSKIEVIKIPLLQTETVSNIIYLYSMEDDSFVTQGSSLDELAENCLKHKKIKLAHVLHDDKRLWFIDGKINDKELIKVS